MFLPSRSAGSVTVCRKGVVAAWKPSVVDLEGGRSKTIAALALFAVSPLASAQLFEAEGAMKLPPSPCRASVLRRPPR